MNLILDSHSIGWTCAHALSQGMSYKGGRTEVIFGYMKQIFAIFDNFDGDQAAFCWDYPPYKRKDIFPGYKLKKPMSEEEQKNLFIVTDQFKELKEYILPQLGFVNIFEVEGYESDDIIAKLVIDRSTPDETIVISGDEDLFQLLDYCSVYSITKKQTTTKKIFEMHYRLQPKDWVLVKAIGGCGSDKVPGVAPGIGSKTAISYLLDELKKTGKKYNDIKNDKENPEGNFERNLKLVKLPFKNTPAPRLRKNNLSMESFKYICKEYGLDSFLERDMLRRWENIVERFK